MVYSSFHRTHHNFRRLQVRWDQFSPWIKQFMWSYRYLGTMQICVSRMIKESGIFIGVCQLFLSEFPFWAAVASLSPCGWFCPRFVRSGCCWWFDGTSLFGETYPLFLHVAPSQPLYARLSMYSFEHYCSAYIVFWTEEPHLIFVEQRSPDFDKFSTTWTTSALWVHVSLQLTHFLISPAGLLLYYLWEFGLFTRMLSLIQLCFQLERSDSNCPSQCPHIFVLDGVFRSNHLFI